MHEAENGIEYFYLWKKLMTRKKPDFNTADG